MSLRLSLSKLASAEARQVASRLLAILSVAGFALTLVVVVAAGGRPDAWVFVLLVWALFVYLPLRILLEAAQTLAPALRRRLVAQAAAQPGRYGTRPGIELMVDGLFERAVVLPRIATPVQAAKARDGAVAILGRARAEAAVLREVAVDCLASVDRWTADLGARAAGDARQSIQARWGEVRALAALAAMTKVLIAAYEDRSGMPFGRGDGPLPDPAGFLDACLDYCDTLALEVDALPWEEASLRLPLDAPRAEEIRQAWTRYAETGAPAREARNAFLATLFAPEARARGPA